MKRHPALQSLSDDHHGALVLARRIVRVAAACRGAAELAEAWADVRRRFDREHVRFEERELFPRAEAVLSLAELEAAGRATLDARP